MIEIKATKENLEKFIDNICDEDKQELMYFLKDDYKSKFVEILLKNQENTYFLSHLNIPVAIGGLSFDKLNRAVVWLLCSNEYKKHKIELFKYVLNKIKLFKSKHNFLYNYIYKSNFKALKWLEKCGFKSLNLKNVNDFKFFYYKN